MTGDFTYRNTWGQVKDQVGLPLGLCGDHPDLLNRVNEASLVLWNAGDWIHKFARYKFRVGSSCCGNRYITWPTEIETIECLNVCNSPIQVKNLYYEFIANGLGNLDRQNRSYGGFGLFGNRFQMLGDREEVCTFEDIQGTFKKIFVHNGVPADNGTQIIIMGYDNNGQWIRSQVDGKYVDGEYLTLNTNDPPLSANYFSKITSVQFSVTPRNGTVTLVEYDNPTASQRTIAVYQYNEAVPIYRRSVLTGITQLNPCEFVVGLVRLRFQKILYDTDFIQIGNLSALTEMLIALQKRDNGVPRDAQVYQLRAEKILDNELKQYQGIAPKKNVGFQNRLLWGTAHNMR